MEFTRYEEVPPSEVQKIVDETKKFKESKE